MKRAGEWTPHTDTHEAVMRAITTGEPLRELFVEWCECGKRVASVVAWRDGRRYLWVPPTTLRHVETGKLLRPRAALGGLDDGDAWHWGHVCRCGAGFLFSTHITNAADAPGGVVGMRFAVDDRARVGDAVTTWSLVGTEPVRVLDRLWVHRLGKGTAATITPD